MYVEISPRQSGKTTRLIQAASDYLRHNPTHNITIVGFHQNNLTDLKNKLVRTGQNIDRIKFMSYSLFGRYSNCFFREITEPDYWFFDEFGCIKEEHVRHPISSNVIENAYYCTTPGHSLSTNTVVEHCIDRGIQIHFNNPWTEQVIQENLWSDYVRDSVLGDWVRFMESKGLFNGIKINLIRKEIRKHRFTSW